ncbi:MAG: Enoyl-CoA hydratase/isomerase [Frankiales bacterium]|jgi:enoyl-CoA hydratase|nr:Enoyl-CoA hydratase/isomerase [Frankiales bacterium]
MRVHTEDRGRVLVVRMDRTDKRNAIDAEMTAELDAALNRLEDDNELWAGVLTGGDEVFCAGTDLIAGAGTPTERGGPYGVVGRTRTKPLVAAVEGLALGGGMELVLACDLVVAGAGATFGLPEVSRGVVATCGALFRGPRALPLNVARELLLTGDRLTADRAERLGFVNRLTPDGDALAQAVALAERVCENAPLSVRATLKAVEQLVGADDQSGWTATTQATATVMASQDLREGMSAFAEKRSPVWQGR